MNDFEYTVLPPGFEETLSEGSVPALAEAFRRWRGTVIQGGGEILAWDDVKSGRFSGADC